MLKYLKRKHVSGEDNDDESQIPQSSTSKGKASDVKKKIAFTITVIWPLDLHGQEKKTVHFLFVLFEGKSSLTQLWPQPS